MRLRPYHPALDPELLALWHAAMPSHPITPGLWAAITWGDPSFVPEDLLVIEHEGMVAGFALAKRYRGDFPGCARYRAIGWLSLFAVAPAQQGRGLGSHLLALAEARLAGPGVQRLQVGGSFHHVMPGAPSAASRDWLAGRGYTPGARVWDVVGALSEGFPKARLPEGVTCRPYADEAAIRAFMQAHFPGRWARDVSLALDQRGLSGEILGLFRGDEPLGFCWIHPPGSEGALRWAGWNPRIAALGPIGVRQDARGTGLGLGLLLSSLAALAERGADETVIDWTDLVDFYARAGFAPWLGYTLMEKAVP